MQMGHSWELTHRWTYSFYRLNTTFLSQTSHFSFFFVVYLDTCLLIFIEDFSLLSLLWIFKVTCYMVFFFFGICCLKSEVSQSCPTLCDPMDCSLSGFSVHGIFQARVPEWFAFSFSRGSSRPRDRTQVSRIAGRHFTLWAIREA